MAAGAEQQTGISSDVLKKMLPVVAMMVAGYMAKQSGDESGGGGLGGLIGGLLGGGNQSSGGALGGLGSLLDLDGDGNPLDDIIGMAGKLAR